MRLHPGPPRSGPPRPRRPGLRAQTEQAGHPSGPGFVPAEPAPPAPALAAPVGSAPGPEAERVATPKAPADPEPTPLAHGTLGRKLVLRVVALVALAAILLSAAATLATRQLLLHNVDQQLNASTGRFQHDQGQGPDPGGGLLQPGQQIGTLAAAFTSSSQWINGFTLGENRQRYAVPSTAQSELTKLTDADHPTSATLTGLGHYRIVSYQLSLDTGTSQPTTVTIIVGVPLAQVDGTLVALIITQAILSVLAIGGAAIGARALVLRSLRPLNRVAGIAQQVSRLPLDRGEVALAVRVPPVDADPTSEVGRVGQAINHMLANVDGALAARQASEMKVRQFVADASHELRNPLASIRGYAELTRRGREDLPPDTAFAMSRVESEATRMSKLVEDLLLLARLDSGPDLVVGSTDLTQLVIDAVSDARAAGPDHRWALDLPDEPVLAVGDRNRLLQVLTNLLANARNHTPEGTTVEVGLGRVIEGTPRAMITVTDDGPGIPESLQSTVFERFTRADSSRARSLNGTPVTSTGLGLAIVAAVVDAHQGEVRVESRPGRTRFTVLLPPAP